MKIRIENGVTRIINHSQHRISSGQVGGAAAGAGCVLSVERKRIYLACGKTDMRKQINRLAAIVEGDFKWDPFDKSVFVFCNGDRNCLKILEWDRDGFLLYFKRLEKGRIRWPA